MFLPYPITTTTLEKFNVVRDINTNAKYAAYYSGTLNYDDEFEVTASSNDGTPVSVYALNSNEVGLAIDTNQIAFTTDTKDWYLLIYASQSVANVLLTVKTGSAIQTATGSSISYNSTNKEITIVPGSGNVTSYWKVSQGTSSNNTWYPYTDPIKIENTANVLSASYSAMSIELGKYASVTSSVKPV